MSVERTPHKWEHVLPYTTNAVRCVRCGLTFVAVADLSRADTFADGLATRATYDMTFPALREGLTGFVAVPDAEIAEGVRLMIRTTHNLAEGAGAAGLAGLRALRDTLSKKTVAIILSGANIDEATLTRVMTRDL